MSEKFRYSKIQINQTIQESKLQKVAMKGVYCGHKAYVQGAQVWA